MTIKIVICRTNNCNKEAVCQSIWVFTGYIAYWCEEHFLKEWSTLSLGGYINIKNNRWTFSPAAKRIIDLILIHKEDVE